MKTTKKQLEKSLQEKEEMYHNLVWYARSSSPKPEIAHLRGITELMYPEETKALQEDEDNWQHGFNSGMLAGMRFALGYMHNPVIAEEEFPFLDT
jgi:hypothetical protein